MGATSLGLAGGLFLNIRVASAQTLTGAVPAVDRLSVQVVTDSHADAPEPSGRHDDVIVQRNPRARSLANEFGLALYLDSTRGSEVRRVLADFGFTPETFNGHLAILGIDPARLEATALTHGHSDHFGGMATQELPGKVRLSSTGTRFTFSA